MFKTFTSRTYFICFTLLSVLANIHYSNAEQRVSSLRSPDIETQLIWKKKKNEPKPKFEYHELVFTTIDVVPFDDGSNKVHFSGSIKADFDDTTGVFLRDIIETDEKDGDSIVYEAKQVSLDEVKEILAGKHVLFCIHGYWDEPETVLTEFKRSKGEFAHYTPIPVIWPTYDVSAGNFYLNLQDSYDHDKKVSEAVGRTLGHILGEVVNGGHWPANAKVSLMAHSMGNRVLRFFAMVAENYNLPIKFGNIFMVAADVEKAIFEKQEGVNIVHLLADGGMVYVIHRKDDTRLKQSARVLNGSFRNPKNRLGQFGADLTKLHSNTEGKVTNVDVLGFPAYEGDEGVEHGYHLCNYMVWLYESKSE